MSQAANNNWYILCTTARAERTLKDRLETLGVECWLPLHETPRVWSERVRLIRVPMYPTCLFVRCGATEIRDLPQRVQGMARVLCKDGMPAILREATVDAVAEWIGS